MAIDPDDKPRARAKAYILANPSATNKAIAATLGISQRTVGYAREALVNKGLVPPAWGDKKSKFRRRRSTPIPARTSDPTIAPSLTPELAPTEGTPFDTQSTADLNAAVAQHLGGDTLRPDRIRTQYTDEDENDEDTVDVSKLKKILWRIARHADDDRVRTTAIWTLTRIQQSVDERPLGPGIPKNRSEIIERLLQLFDGVGVAIVIEAMNTYLARRKASEAPDAGQISTITSETERSTT